MPEYFDADGHERDAEYPRRWSPYTLRRNNYESKQAPTNMDAKKQRNNLYTAVTNNTSTIHTGA